MKHTIVFLLILLAAANYCMGQNLLSPIWKYNNAEDFNEAEILQCNQCPEVNLLLSWERQGLCWIDKQIVLWNEFRINETDTNLQLEFSLQGDVQTVYINQHPVAANINNTFWTNRGQKTTVNIPDSILFKNKTNEIKILISNLSYTGGISHNFCSISAKESNIKNSLSIDFPVKNHVYQINDQKQFILQSNNDTNTKVRLIINNDFHKTIIDKVLEIQQGSQKYLFRFDKWNLDPGIYECMAISQGDTYCSTAEWFTIQPEEISDPVRKVSGFDDFWQQALNDLQKIDPNYKIKKVDSLCSPTRNGYVVEMNSLGNLTIRGYYFVPKTAGKHPAILHVPGYSYGFENLESFLKRETNCAELAICVRGHGISKDVFNPWDTMTLWAVGICNKEEYIYRSIFMDCVRAVDFLSHQDEIDHTRIGVAGGSQGGGLTLITAALCNANIAACAFFDPWLCDIRDQAKIRTMVNKELTYFKSYPGVVCDTSQMFSVLDYFDAKNFVPEIKCPAYFSTSLFDDDCPSHCGFSAYNNLKTKKSYKVYPKDSHLGESGEYDELFYAVEKMLLEK